MTLIEQLKKKSPAYAALSDNEISDKLYNKHYQGKISREDYNHKVGNYQIDYAQDDEIVRKQVSLLPETQRNSAIKQWQGAKVHKEWEGAGEAAKAFTTGVSALSRGTFVGEWLDEADAYVDSGLNKVTGGYMGKPYQESLEYSRARDREVDQRSPTISLAGKIVGGLAGGGAALKATSKAGKVAGLAVGGPMPTQFANTLSGGVAQGVKYGAAHGAVAGAGAAEGGALNRMEGAAHGAKYGAAFGAALPVAGAAIGKTLPFVSSSMRRTSEILTRPDAYQMINRHVDDVADVEKRYYGGLKISDDLTGGQVQTPLMLADMTEGLGSAGYLAATANSTGKNIASKALKSRLDDQAVRMNRVDEIAFGLDRNTSATRTRAAIEQARKDEAKKLYKDAYAQPTSSVAASAEQQVAPAVMPAKSGLERGNDAVQDFANYYKELDIKSTLKQQQRAIANDIFNIENAVSGGGVQNMESVAAKYHTLKAKAAKLHGDIMQSELRLKEFHDPSIVKPAAAKPKAGGIFEDSASFLSKNLASARSELNKYSNAKYSVSSQNASAAKAPTATKNSQPFDISPVINKVLMKIGDLSPNMPENKALQEAVDLFTHGTQVGDGQIIVHNLRGFDRVKQVIDGRINAANRKGESYVVAQLTKMKNELLDLADNSNEAYAYARRQFAEKSGKIDAIEFGQKANKGVVSPDEFAQSFPKLSKTEQHHARIGVADGLKTARGQQKSGHNRTNYSRKDNVLDRIEVALPNPNQAQNYRHLQDIEHRFATTNNKVLGGSPTAEKNLLHNAEIRASALKSSYVDMAMNFVVSRLTKIFKIRDKEATKAAEILFETDPQKIAHHFTKLKERLGEKRAKYLVYRAKHTYQDWIKSGVKGSAVMSRQDAGVNRAQKRKAGGLMRMTR